MGVVIRPTRARRSTPTPLPSQKAAAARDSKYHNAQHHTLAAWSSLSTVANWLSSASLACSSCCSRASCYGGIEGKQTKEGKRHRSVHRLALSLKQGLCGTEAAFLFLCGLGSQLGHRLGRRHAIRRGGRRLHRTQAGKCHRYAVLSIVRNESRALEMRSRKHPSKDATEDQVNRNRASRMYALPQRASG